MLNIFFPKICNGCKRELISSEKIICSQCRHDLPLVCHHRNNDSSMARIFYGRIPIESATAIIQFQKKGISQELMHNLKYRGQSKIGNFFGQWLGSELAEHPNYQKVDMVIPVPLHKNKLRKRGYNQVEGFGKEIAMSLQVPYLDNVLVKVSQTKSQVFKKRFTRIQGDEIFQVANNKSIINKHILLVDDIVTTGATIENCATQLLLETNAKLSIATIAIA